MREFPVQAAYQRRILVPVRGCYGRKYVRSSRLFASSLFSSNPLAWLVTRLDRVGFTRPGLLNASFQVGIPVHSETICSCFSNERLLTRTVAFWSPAPQPTLYFRP